MSLKKIAKKSRVGVQALRDEGLLGFSIRSLGYLKKQTSKTKKGRKSSIYTRVKLSDAIQVDTQTPPPLWLGTKKKILQFNWIMPPPGKGSGGHTTLFRFIQALENAGHKCHLYFYTQDGGNSVSEIKQLMEESFPPVAASMSWLNSAKDISDADGLFATSWETAYPSYISRAKGKRFYFVQDFEPYFYAVGGLSTLAENTYKFGFHGITAGGWLAKKLRDEYGMQTDAFEFGSDLSVYKNENSKKRKEILCYVRPFTERRGFEIAIMTLALFHKKHPDYTINLFGWDVAEYDMPFPFVNLGILQTNELNDLYNRCVAGLVLSFTNMSLLPLELLGSGTIPVVNDGKNNRLVSDNKFIAYTDSDPVSLANTLSKIATREDQTIYSQKASASVQSKSWEASTEAMVRIVEKQTREKRDE